MKDQLPIESQAWLDQLRSPDPHQRIEALKCLGEIRQPTPELTLAIERSALSDQDPGVKEAALELLSMPQFQLSQRMFSLLPPEIRVQIQSEIGNWERELLISPIQARLLRGRMGSGNLRWQEKIVSETPASEIPVEAAPDEAETILEIPEPEPYVEPSPIAVKAAPVTAMAKKAAARTPKSEPFSISKLLFSETSIKVALFLGAFFVLAAAIILMALVEVARLPILGAATLGFFSGALALKRHLPLASIVLFIVGILLLPIDAAVIASMVRIFNYSTYWGAVAALASSIVTFGFVWYESRLFSILGYLGYVVALALLSAAVKLDPKWAVGIQLVFIVAGLIVSYRVFLWRDRHLFFPFFVLIQVDLLILLFYVYANLSIELTRQYGLLNEWWLAMSAYTGLAGLAYLLSDWIRRKVGVDFPFFTLLSVLFLTIAPLLLLQSFQPGLPVLLTLACGWGLVLTGLGEVVNNLRKPAITAYAVELYLAGLGMFIFSAGRQAFIDIRYAAGYLAVIAGLYIFFAIRRIRWAFWSLGLSSAYLAYLAVYQFPALGQRDVFLGIVHLYPTLAFLSLGVFLQQRTDDRRWWLPPLGLGFLACALAVLFSLWLGFDAPATSAWIFLILAVYAALVSVIIRTPYLASGATLSLAISLIYFLQPWEKTGFLLPLAGLATGYYGLGQLLQVDRRTRPWSMILRLSGLSLAGFLAFLQLVEIQSGAFLVYLLLALSLGWEALSLRRVAPGFLSLAALAAGLGFMLYEQKVPTIDWGYYFTGLAALYYFAGRGLQLDQRSQPWSFVLRLSGMVLAAGLGFYEIGSWLPGTFLTFLLMAVALGWESLSLVKDSAYLASTALAASLYYLLFELDLPTNHWGWYFTGLACAYFLAGWLLNRVQRIGPRATTLRVSGLVLVVLVIALQAGLNTWSSSLGSALLAVFLAVEALMGRRHRLTYLAAASLALALAFTVLELRIIAWQGWFIGLALAYYGAGWVLTRLEGYQPFGEALALSGLGLGMLSSFATVGVYRSELVVLVALVGACFAFEGLRKKNFWFSYPACALFYLAYLLGLNSANATQPQVYSVGAALLGIVLHYITLRNNQWLAALVTGVGAQLILLSTTYYQMVDSGQILFFYLVFFQSLILLVYGLLARSRSFVGIPVFFSILTVVTVTFSLLKGLSTAILIGGTGLVLLFLGTISLLLRERVVQMADRFSQHLSNW